MGSRCRHLLFGRPYVTDQLAMARMPRATFALMLALMPACATAIGAVVLGRVPTAEELCGIGLVVVGLLVHVSPEAGGTGQPALEQTAG